MKNYKDVEAYLLDQSESIIPLLITIRELIQSEAPEAIEKISYGMPAYHYRGKPLIYFAAQKKHLGIYATPNAHNYFEEQLQPYKRGKGSVQFPYNRAIPFKIIREMIQFNLNAIDQLTQ
ncbi:MAG: hypothetical protein RLZZ248_827 [Bacteroidota bacterium]|jgi:uncharacterized protein YdhG (YjbR/CyaY superfamily)